MEKQTLLEVLNYIKQECQNNEHCYDCPFYSDDMCRIQNPPEDWELKENEKEKKWTPFKD